MKSRMKGRDAESDEDTGYGEGSRYAAHLDRGWSLLERGDLEPARTAAEHAAQTRPDDPDAAMLLGAIALAEGDPAESVAAYERAAELDPDYLEAYAAAAQVCLLDLDEPMRALAYCEDALSLEGLGPFEALDLGLLAADCELAADREAAARSRLATMPSRQVLLAALALLGDDDDSDDDDLEIDLGTDRGAALAFLRTDFEGEPLDDDDRTERASRILALSLRLARLQLDAGDVDAARELSGQVAMRFSGEPDAWHLLSEAAHRAGDSLGANAAGLETLRLDLEQGTPSWVPTPAIIHRRALRLLAASGDDGVVRLATADPPPALLVRDAPPPELVLEGVDPRIPALALASRSGDDGPPRLTGVALYRSNIARYAGDADRFEAELRWSLLDEVTAFMGLSDERRDALGLPPLPAAMRAVEPVVTEDETPRRKPRRRTKAAAAAAPAQAKSKAKAKAKPKA
jgi:tetratricopeptide (TPR) repeat protein